MRDQEQGFGRPPSCVEEYVNRVIRKIGHRKKVRMEVRRELTNHFEDALGKCRGEEEKELAERLISEFGEPKLLAGLIRRGKRRCQPLWLRALIRTVQTSMVLGLVLAVYAGWLFTGEPERSVDYVAMMNQRVVPLNARPEDNAWPYYKRAIDQIDCAQEIVELKANCDEITTDLSDPEREVISEWLERHESVWEDCLVGVEKPYCWRTYEPRNGDDRLFAIVRTHEIDVQWLTVLYLRLRFLAHPDRGEVEQALQDCLVLAKIGAHQSRSGGWSTIEQLYGMYWVSRACRQIRHVLDRWGLSLNTLTEVQTQLESLFPDGFPLLDGTSMKLESLDLVQNTYSSGGLGGGHFIPNQYRTVDGWIAGFHGYSDESAFMRKAFLRLLYTAAGMFQAGKNKVTKRIQEDFERYKDLLKMAPHERHISKEYNMHKLADGFAKYCKWRGRYHLARYVSGYAMADRSDGAFMGKVEYESTLTVLALKRWRLEKGQYPKELEELLGGYLTVLPDDPFSDETLRYERRGDDFILYSCAFDFDDDGGIQTAGEYVRGVGYPAWGQTEEGGDRVFWPVM